MATPVPIILKALAQQKLGWLVHGYPWKCAGKIPLPDKHPQARCICGKRVLFEVILQPFGANMFALSVCGGCSVIWWMELLPPVIPPLKVRPA